MMNLTNFISKLTNPAGFLDFNFLGQALSIGSSLLGSGMIGGRGGPSAKRGEIVRGGGLPPSFKTGLFRTDYVKDVTDPFNEGLFTSRLTGRGQALTGMLQGQTQGFSDLLGSQFQNMGQMDTEGNIQRELDLLRRLSEPYEMQQLNRMEDRLFNRGQMGTTGGSMARRGFQQELLQADRQRILDSILGGREEETRQLQNFTTLQGLFGAGLKAETDFAMLPSEVARGGSAFSAFANAGNQLAGTYMNQANLRDSRRSAFWNSVGGALKDIDFGGGGGFQGSPSSLRGLFNAGQAARRF